MYGFLKKLCKLHLKNHYQIIHNITTDQSFISFKCKIALLYL